MFLTPRFATRSPSRRWAAVAVLATFAVTVTVTAAAPEDKPAKAEPEKVKPKEPPADFADFQKRLLELVRDGDPDQAELRKLVEELNKQVAEQLREIGPGAFQLQPGQFQFANPFAPAAPAKPALRVQYEKRLKQFEEDIAKAENADAAATLKKGRDAYIEAMAAELKKADDEARKNPPAQGFPNFQPFPPLPNIEVIPFPAFPGGENPFGGRAGAVRARPTRLGIAVEKPTAALAEQLDLPADTGVVVASVVAGSVAEKAGLKKSDVLLKVAGNDVPGEPAAFTELVAKLKAGEKFDVELIRKGKKETVKGVELPQERRLENLPARGGPAFSQMQVQVNNGDVTIQATADGVTFDITGTAANGRVTPDKIAIDDGGKKTYESLDKVPEKHRTAVEKLLNQVRAFGR